MRKFPATVSHAEPDFRPDASRVASWRKWQSLPTLSSLDLGAVGSAALYQSAKLGAKVIGIDRFTPPHDQGSSHGETRITRQAIGEGREFVPLVLRSNEIWEELEAATGRNLMTRNGGLVLATSGLGGSHHGSSSFLQDTIDAAEAFGIPHQRLSTDEIRRPLSAVSPDRRRAGILRARRRIPSPRSVRRNANRAGAQARREGLHLRDRAEVKSSGGTVSITTDQATYAAAKVILTAGPWITRFLPPEYAAHFRVYRQTLCWFALARNSEALLARALPRLHLDHRQPRAGHALRLPCHRRPCRRHQGRHGALRDHRRSGQRAARCQRRIDCRDVFRVHRTALSRSQQTAVCVPRPACTRSRPTPSSSSTMQTPRRTFCSPRRVPGTASSTRRRWAKPWRSGLWVCRRKSTCRLFAGNA